MNTIAYIVIVAGAAGIARGFLRLLDILERGIGRKGGGRNG